MEDSISPVTRTKDEARANYNRLSRWYDWIASSEARYRQIGVQALKSATGGTRPGNWFWYWKLPADFARQISSDGWVCGIDLSDGMAEVAGTRLSEAGLDERVALALGDAVHMPFADDSFDAIFYELHPGVIRYPRNPAGTGSVLQDPAPGWKAGDRHTG